MANKRFSILRVLGVTIALVVTWWLNVLLHELGHAVVLEIGGGKTDFITMMPGLEIYPELKVIPWNGYAGMVQPERWPDPPYWYWFYFMGSGSTLLAAYLCLPIIAWTRGAVRVTVAMFAVWCAWDIILYSTLPLVGIPHWVLFGGPTAEPYLAAMGLEILVWEYFIYLAVHTLFFHLLLRRCWRGRRGQAKAIESAGDAKTDSVT